MIADGSALAPAAADALAAGLPPAGGALPAADGLVAAGPHADMTRIIDKAAIVHLNRPGNGLMAPPFALR